MISAQSTETTKSSREISELTLSPDVRPGTNLGCVIRIHSLSFAYIKRSSQNTSQEVKFAWQGLNYFSMTNQWTLIDPKQGYGNLEGFKVNFWEKKNVSFC